MKTLLGALMLGATLTPTAVLAADQEVINAIANLEAAAVVCATVYPGDYRFDPEGIAVVVAPLIMHMATAPYETVEDIAAEIHQRAIGQLSYWNSYAIDHDMHHACDHIIDSGVLGAGLRRPVS